MSNSRSSQPTDRVAVARVSGAHGLRGGLRLELLTDWPEDILVGAELFIEGESAARTVVSMATGGRVPLMTLDGIDSREAAERLIGTYLETPARELPPGEYWWHDLEGLAVVNETGAPVGELREVFRAGAGEVYRVVGDDGERLIPALRSAILSIDLGTRIMVVRDEDAYVAEG
jgi:16S rRNA processing protein RimM